MSSENVRQVAGSPQTLMVAAKKGVTNAKDAIKWFYKRLKGDYKDSPDPRNKKLTIGHMYMFGYDPKTKDKLPYWDAAPLVIPIEYYADGFLGINLHYIPPIIRSRLLQGMIKNFGKSIDEKQYMKVSYGQLSGLKNLRMFQPCLKRYLYSHCRSTFKRVPPSEWVNAILLPTAKWMGASSSAVYRNSLGRI